MMKMMDDGSLSPPEFYNPGSSSNFNNKQQQQQPPPQPLPRMGDINVALSLRCPICQEPYTEPKQLNCGHSFCLTCLEGSQHLYSINCPICRKATCFSAPGLNGLRLLPSNYALAQIVDAVEAAKSAGRNRRRRRRRRKSICSSSENDYDNEEEDDEDDGDDITTIDDIVLAGIEKIDHAATVQCFLCGHKVANDRAWFCADCENDGGDGKGGDEEVGYRKLCTACIVERHRGAHRCVQMAELGERWRAFSRRLDTLKTKLTPVRTSLRQIAGSVKNIAASDMIRALEERSEFLSRTNETIEDLLEKAEVVRSSPPSLTDCKRYIDFERALAELETYAGIRTNELKENVEETVLKLNKIIADVDELEKSTNEKKNEQKTADGGRKKADQLVNVLVAWKPAMTNSGGGGKSCSVSLAGSFTEWKPTVRLVPYNGEFITTLALPPGRHEFKFLVDDKWKQSDHYESCVDGCGGRNNFLIV